MRPEENGPITHLFLRVSNGLRRPHKPHGFLEIERNALFLSLPSLSGLPATGTGRGTRGTGKHWPGRRG